ncbi:hypothetical protein HanPSC8_Chr10g0411071 [Helianthus annuus]|nr:hypothetical protein HanPSC8_Chr10g0411071 [Helianthus annuus]
MILENKVNACLMVKPDTRGTLIKLMQLMVSHHPSRRFNTPQPPLAKSSTIINFGFCLT